MLAWMFDGWLSFGGFVTLLGFGFTAMFVCGYVFQNHLLYIPSLPQAPRHVMFQPAQFQWHGEQADYVNVPLTAADGTRLHAWFFRVSADAGVARQRPTFVFYHSNAGNLSHRVPNIRMLMERLRVNVFILSYRGYGQSAGEPSERGLVLDGHAALDYCLSGERAEIDPRKLVLFGRSLGCCVAIAVAAERSADVRAVVVENPFTSIDEMIDVVLVPMVPPIKYVKFLSKNKWDQLAAIARVRAPLLVVSSALDEIVPAHMHARLHDAAKQSEHREMHVFVDAKHMTAFQHPRYFDRVGAFVDAALSTPLDGQHDVWKHPSGHVWRSEPLPASPPSSSS
eukprot:CAMPEP_0198331458 /NCGR_PEP_ID=MMETSP1450-20131203/17598_1 /TAXON_ID=753684 ORGANISM="Madagascaria erythrocladiodes, Strain CCMP3234" /NCGR_SAMPLE_ID=MMETSP1450 /ASSEMBLY_ACC=CAM_ASM_001115 /LENGTH=338 /DNA_ID=CAMNT_0044035831 /DNA_START=1 /DNA_END=1014 /DNA_ORIENTATION=-